MIKRILVLSLLLPCFLSANLDQTVGKLTKELEHRFPSLALQLSKISTMHSLPFNYQTATEKLIEYLKHSHNSELDKAMQLILSLQYLNAKETQKEWQDITHKTVSEEGSIQLRGYLDENNILFIKEKLKEKQAAYYVFHFDATGDINYDFQIAVWENQGVVAAQVSDYQKNTFNALELGCKIKIGELVELSIPLNRVLSKLKLTQKNKLQVYANVKAKDSQKIYTAGPLIIKKKLDNNNNALLLLLYLMEKNKYQINDLMSICLALTDSFIYQMGDKKVRQQILLDIVGMYDYYIAISLWQKQSFNFNLQDYPFLAKLQWADRVSLSHEFIYRLDVDTIDLAIYQTYIITPSLLKQILKVIEGNQLVKKHDLKQTLYNIEIIWNAGKYTPRSEQDKKETFSAEEKKLITKKDARMKLGDKTLNYFEVYAAPYQFGLYVKYQQYFGNCGMQTSVTRAFFKTIGIADMRFWFSTINGQTWIPAKTHAFTGYFEPDAKKYYAVQDWFDILKSEPDEKTWFFVYKPFTADYENYTYCDYLNFSEIKDFLKTGMSYPLYQKLFDAEQSYVRLLK